MLVNDAVLVTHELILCWK